MKEEKGERENTLGHNATQEHTRQHKHSKQQAQHQTRQHTEEVVEGFTTYIITSEEHRKIGQRPRPGQVVGRGALEIQHCHGGDAAAGRRRRRRRHGRRGHKALHEGQKRACPSLFPVQVRS